MQGPLPEYFMTAVSAKKTEVIRFLGMIAITLEQVLLCNYTFEMPKTKVTCRRLDENMGRWMKLGLGAVWPAVVLTPVPSSSNQATGEFSMPAHLATDSESQHGP